MKHLNSKLAATCLLALMVVIAGGVASATPSRVAHVKVVRVDTFAAPAVYAPTDACPDATANGAYAMTGTLEGCWYTDTATVLLSQDHPDGTTTVSYGGTEHFVGCVHLDGHHNKPCGPKDPSGSWKTTYVFNEIINTSTQIEISGGCEHPIFQGSGDGGFTGVGGIIFMTDNTNGTFDVSSNVTGSISLPRD